MAHPLLERQLRRLGIEEGTPPSPDAWAKLLDRIGKAYKESDEGRYTLERSMQLSSKEMRELYERLRASQADLAAEHGRLQAIFASLADGVCVFDTEQRCQLLNPAAERLLAVSDAAARGRALGDLVKGVDVDLRGVATSVRVDDARLERTDGRSFPASLVVAPIWRDDVVQGTVVVIRDITAHQQLELELRQAQKLESVGRLAAGVAHEINTPIQFVSDSVTFVRDAFSDLKVLVGKYRASNRSILAGRPSGESAREAEQAEETADLEYALTHVPAALERSLEGLDRVATIVASMKEFAHPDQRQMSAIDLNQAIRSTLTISLNEYKYVADVETDLRELPVVTCHPGEINQAILNIVVNAAHAISDVVGKDGRKGRIRVATRRDGDFAVLSISDTGGGIPVAIRDKIFEPFFTTKEVGRGTGQGLAIARSVVVDKHGGELTFETEAGRGTTFFVRIPIAGVRAAVHA